MAEERQLVCDGCREIVHGKFKAAFITKDYITFKGTLGLNIAQTKNTARDFIFLTPRYDGPPPEMVFCNKAGLPCIELFIQSKKAFVDSVRHKEYQSETDKHLGKAGTHERDFVIGGKKY